MTNEEAKHIIDSSEYFWMRPTAKEREALNIATNSLTINSKYDPWNPVSEWPKTTSEDVLVCDIDGDIYKAYMSEYDGWRRSEDFEKISLPFTVEKNVTIPMNSTEKAVLAKIQIVTSVTLDTKVVMNGWNEVKE